MFDYLFTWCCLGIYCCHLGCWFELACVVLYYCAFALGVYVFDYVVFWFRLCLGGRVALVAWLFGCGLLLCLLFSVWVGWFVSLWYYVFMMVWDMFDGFCVVVCCECCIGLWICWCDRSTGVVACVCCALLVVLTSVVCFV